MAVNTKDLAAAIQRFEREQYEQYRSFQIRGFSAWQIIKRPVFYNLLRGIFTMGGGKRKKKSVLRDLVLPLIRFPFSLLRIRFRKGKGTVVVISQDGYKFEKDEKGRLISNYADHWYDAAGEKGVFLEYHQGTKEDQVGAIPEDADIRFLNPCSRLLLIAFRKKITNSKVARFFARTLHETVAPDTSEATLRQIIGSIYAKFLLDYVVYRLLIRVLRPAALVVTDAVGTGAMAAAIRAGVPVIENQHGHFDINKPDYMMDRDTLGKAKDQLVLPSRIAVFGAFFQDQLLKHSIWTQEMIRPVGNRRVDTYRAMTRKEATGSLRILVPTQWSFFEETQKLMQTLADLTATLPLTITLKLHPREPEAHRKWFQTFIIGKPQFILCGNEASLYELFLDCDLVVGYDSTSLFEAVAMGLPVITIPTDASPAGLHTYVQNKQIVDAIRLCPVEDIAKMIASFRQQEPWCQEWIQNIPETGNYLYTVNCIQNCRDVLAEITRS